MNPAPDAPIFVATNALRAVLGKYTRIETAARASMRSGNDAAAAIVLDEWVDEILAAAKEAIRIGREADPEDVIMSGAFQALDLVHPVVVAAQGASQCAWDLWASRAGTESGFLQ